MREWKFIENLILVDGTNSMKSQSVSNREVTKDGQTAENWHVQAPSKLVPEGYWIQSQDKITCFKVKLMMI